MRIKINFKGSNTAYENNNLKQVKGWFEDNAIGRHNDMHDKFSNYSLSPMMGGKRNGKYISYPDGGYIYFTTMDIELINMVSNKLFCNWLEILNTSGLKVYLIFISTLILILYEQCLLY